MPHSVKHKASVYFIYTDAFLLWQRENGTCLIDVVVILV